MAGKLEKALFLINKKSGPEKPTKGFLDM